MSSQTNQLNTIDKQTLIAAKEHFKNHDLVIYELINRYPNCDIKKHTNYYETLVTSIISQQLSVKAADSIFNRFKGIFDGQMPTPEQIVESDHELLRSVGLSNAKVNYIKDLAQRIISGEVKLNDFKSLANNEIIDELTKVKGIGVWTAQMFLMFCMARTDVLAHGDLGIRKGVMLLYKLNSMPSEDQVIDLAISNNWEPYQTIACWYVWQSLDNKQAV